MRFLKKHINKLISTFESGLSIGSYLSQFLCNLYMSQLYHEISETCIVLENIVMVHLKELI